MTRGNKYKSLAICRVYLIRSEVLVLKLKLQEIDEIFPNIFEYL